MAVRKPDAQQEFDMTYDDEYVEYELSNLAKIIINKRNILSHGGIAHINSAPGSGKTYATGGAIAKMWLDGDIVYIITMVKNNLKNDISKLKSEAMKYIPKDMRQDLEDCTIIAKSTEDCWRDYLEDKSIPRIENSPCVTKKLKDLADVAKKKAYKLIDSHENDNTINEIFRSELSAADYQFRRELKVILSEHKTDEDQFLKDNPFITTLYPFVRKNIERNGKHAIIFATVAKTIYPCDDLHGDTSLLIAQMRETKNGVAIYDEIDQSKVAYKEQLLNDSFHNTFMVSYLLCNYMNRNYLHDIIKAEKDKKKRNDIETHLISIENAAHELDEKYNISDIRRNIDNKTKDEFDNNKGFIVELAYRVLSRGECLYYKPKKSGINEITSEKENAVSLKKVVDDMAAFNTLCISVLPLLLVALKEKDRKEEPYEDTNINSMLETLRFTRNTPEFMYVKNRLLKNSVSYKSDHDSFYTHGISFIYPTIDDNNTQNNTIESAGINTTPESILASIAGKIPVIGLSATGDIKSVLCNYDYGWIKEQGIPVIGMADEERAIITEEHEERFRYRSFVDYTALCARDTDIRKGSDINDQSLYEEVLKISNEYDKSMAEKVLIPRLCKIISGLKEFCRKDKDGKYIHKAGLILTCPDYSKQKMINTWFVSLCRNYIDRNTIPVFANARTFDGEMTKAQNKLKKGERILIFCPYKGGSTGLDYNYEVSDTKQYIRLTDNRRDPRVDFDFLFLSDIRNILPAAKKDDNSSDDQNQGSKEKIQLDLTYIFSELYEYGEISEEERDSKITNMVLGNRPISREYQFGLPSVQYMILKEINQAIGRMERSPYKASVNTIMYDDDFEKILTEDVINDFIYRHDINPLFEEFTNTLLDNIPEDHQAIITSEDIFNNMLTKKNEYVNHDLHFKYGCINMYHPYTQETMDKKRELEQFTLMHPTASEEDFTGHEWIKWYYIKTEDVYYKRKDNISEWDALEVRSDYKKDFIHMSESCARLPEILKINGVTDVDVKERFIQKGYAISWDMGKEYKMTPTLMNNIYKGTLGEEALKEILKNIGTAEITDPAKYENFDFISHNVAIDAKNYMPGAYDGDDKEMMLEKAKEKMDRMDVSACAYVNLFDNGERKTEEQKPIDGKRILIVGDLVDIRTSKIKQSSYNELVRFICKNED